MPRPIRAVVSLPAMRANLAAVRAAAPGARAWAVVKADGYGHGTLNAARGFAAADGLALIDFDEAQRLRGAGWRKPLLMLEGAFEADDVVVAQRLSLTLAVHDEEGLRLLEAAPAGAAPLPVYLKVNSGMNRLGFPADHATVHAAWARLRAAPAVGPLALMTHLACADEPGGADDALATFRRATEGIDAPVSVANSAATLAGFGRGTADLRPGIALYGSSPFGDVRGSRSAAGLGLRAVMRLESRLIAVQHVSAGEAVGYGASFEAAHAMRVGIVACGYADGYPRHAPTGTPIAVDGVLTRTVGRVSMDMLAVDLDPVPAAAPGSPVELWGERVPVDTVARAAGTIGYELLVKRLPRVRLAVEDDAPGAKA